MSPGRRFYTRKPFRRAWSLIQSAKGTPAKGKCDGVHIWTEVGMAWFRRAQKSGTGSTTQTSLSSSGGRVTTGTPGQHGSTGVDETRVRAIGTELLDRARGHKAGLLSAKFYSDKLMDWSMRDHEFKVQLFRFVDAFPVLTTPDMVHDHLADYLTQPNVKLPPGMDLGIKAGGVAKGLMTSTISSQIKGMAGKFIAGTDAASAINGLGKLWKDDIAFSVDLLGEACVSDTEADEFQRRYLDLVMNLPEAVESWSSKPLLETDHMGAIPRVNVSIKVSSLCALFDPIDPDGAITAAMDRLVPVLEAARDRGVFINFDMETFHDKDLTLTLFERCCEAVDFQAGIAMQAYLRSGDDDARRISEWAKRTGRVVTVRLVKGAYWDYETIQAEKMGWPCPVWSKKWETDACFERMSNIFLDSCPTLPDGQTPGEALGPTTLDPGRGGVKLALGSHNVRSIAAALTKLESLGLPQNAIELQMLHGMADQLKHAAGEMGLRVREYVPVGEMIPGMAYLVRRLLENTSNESWLKAGFQDGVDADTLLAIPAPSPTMGEFDSVETDEHPASRQDIPGPVRAHDQSATPVSLGEPQGVHETRDLSDVGPERHMLSPAEPGVGNGRPFFNEPLRDFADGQRRDTFREALARAHVPTVANDRTPEQATAMVDRAHGAFQQWRDADPIKRANAVLRIAAAMRVRRDELSGVLAKEARKPWREADGDVCEAIDFCEYYARMAVGLFRRQRLGRFIGELDELWYQPRGVCTVISPWNFPLAIACGMVSAALVTGNTVVFKPAEQTPGIGKILFDLLQEALRDEFGTQNWVADVLHFCPAPGETTGAALVRDPRVAVIAFTGSKAVGLDIIQAAGLTGEDQMHVKRVVCEMGGKNALIIDSSADLDEAVLGARDSAFGYAGQKCSACSRCIVVDPEGPDGPHITAFTQRLVEASRSLVVGAATHPGTDVPPVIDAEASGRIRSMVDDAVTSGITLALGQDDFQSIPTDHAEGGSDMIAPHIFTGVTPEHAIYQQEVFGPVLAVIHAPSFDAALELANGHAYKLTGGVFTRKPAHIERAKRELRVGNLYVNQKITGALVARQPFGGFGMSGVGSKAGGPDYLLQFVEPRASSENTMRRGFAPEL
jgi:RHH-type proline utilization regulon transcriptional repressor/proline dehydrogenase/delta 1-pyrroline-5-carboxylate dehydrogenase